MGKEDYYRKKQMNGHSLLYWAVKWFKMDNDTFFRMYGFNFNPYKYDGLYEIARRVVCPNERQR